MNISPTEAEEALAVIQAMMRKTRRSISSSGAYAFLIVWGVTWLIGFLNSQFLQSEIAGRVWVVLDVLAGTVSAIFGARMNRGVRSTTPITTGKRIGIFWMLLLLFCAAAIAIVSPLDGKQLAMVIILFVMTGWIAMGQLLSFASIWWGLALTALALFAYFLAPGIFYLVMALLGGGGMIALGVYIRYRW